MKWMRRFAVVLVAIAVFAGGRWSTTWWAWSGAEEGHRHSAAEDPEQAKPTLWTCPMHPEIRLPEPGACPKCDMDLVPLAEDKDGPRRLAMTPAAVQLANIVTAPVSRRFLTMPVRMVGKVDYDETRVRTIAARVAGRLDRLYVDYTGVSVKTDDHLVWLYSPDLLIAQQELIGAKNRIKATAGERSEILPGSNRAAYEAARKKLLLWGLTEAQVDEITNRGTAEDHMLIRSPSEGVVIHKALNQGDYVQEGTPIYRIADLSRLWIQLDAYEQDLPWLRYGQSVSVSTEAFPGEVFEGWVSFLDPTVHERKRTVRVRVNLDNPDGKLKPGMFVRAVAHSRIGAGGRVLEPRLAGKWISPMHPEIVKDGPGQCDVCGMDLVPAESLGYLPAESAVKPIVVPASAVLLTGTRAVVYVEVPGAKRPTFEGREVVLGPRAGEFFIVRAGLGENERVVVNGAFRIDSSMQILAKPSMMSMPGDASSFTGPDTAVFRASLDPLYGAYFDLQAALAGDELEAAREASVRLRESLDGVNVGGLSRLARARWEEEAQILVTESTAAGDAASIESLREHFRRLSQGVLAVERAFKHADDAIRFELFCPMAFDDTGASWLQRDPNVRNPFYGASMLVCGEVRAELPGVSQQTRLAVRPDELPAVEVAEPVAVAVDPEPPVLEPSPDNEGLAGFYSAYFELQQALAADRASEADRAFHALAAATEAVARGRDGAAKAALDELRGVLADPHGDIEAQRARFETVSKQLLAFHAAAGHGGDAPFYQVHCPMAFDNKGADWVQRDQAVLNPYFGARMLRCGSVAAELLPSGEVK